MACFKAGFRRMLCKFKVYFNKSISTGQTLGQIL
jgi:hypothetical protein